MTSVTLPEVGPGRGREAALPLKSEKEIPKDDFSFAPFLPLEEDVTLLASPKQRAPKPSAPQAGKDPVLVVADSQKRSSAKGAPLTDKMLEDDTADPLFGFTSVGLRSPILSVEAVEAGRSFALKQAPTPPHSFGPKDLNLPPRDPLKGSQTLAVSPQNDGLKKDVARERYAPAHQRDEAETRKKANSAQLSNPGAEDSAPPLSKALLTKGTQDLKPPLPTLGNGFDHGAAKGDGSAKGNPPSQNPDFLQASPQKDRQAQHDPLGAGAFLEKRDTQGEEPFKQRELSAVKLQPHTHNQNQAQVKEGAKGKVLPFPGGSASLPSPSISIPVKGVEPTNIYFKPESHSKSNSDSNFDLDSSFLFSDQSTPQGTRGKKGLSQGTASSAPLSKQGKAIEADGVRSSPSPQREASSQSDRVLDHDGRLTTDSAAGGTGPLAPSYDPAYAPQTGLAESRAGKRLPVHAPANTTVPKFVSVALTPPTPQKAGSLSLRLHPKVLGRIEVEVHLTAEGRLDTVVRTEKTEAFELFRADGQALQQVIAEAFEKEADQVTFTLLNQDQGGSNPQEEHGHNPFYQGGGYPRAEEASVPSATAQDGTGLAQVLPGYQLDGQRALDALV